MKNKNNKNKGFSLVELLAAIVIMGILSGLAIISVNYLLQKAQKEYYKAQEDEIILAAKSYTQDNRNELPKRIGAREEIYLSTLQEKKYIGDVVDRNKKKCDPDKSYVQVYRYSKNDYSYTVNLECPGYKSITNGIIDAKPTITINFSNVSGNDKLPDAKASVKITDDQKISTYTYIIYKNGVAVKNSGQIDGKLKKEINFNLSLKDYVPGKITVKVLATNMLGNQSIEEKTVTVENKNAPKCEVLKDNTTWTNQTPVQAQVKCIDQSGTGCKKEIYTLDFYDEGKTGIIEVEDNVGNIGLCEVNTYIDTTAPDIPKLNNKYDGKWTNKSYTIDATSKDALSGIEYFAYSYPTSPNENVWVKYNNSSSEPEQEKTITTTEFKKERSEDVNIIACDRASNCSTPGVSRIMIDKTAPACSISMNPSAPDGNNGWYKSHVTLSINTSNPKGAFERAVASPIKSAALNNGAQTAVQSDTSGATWTGTVVDEAGNSSSCKSSEIKVDATPPEVTCEVFSQSGEYNTKDVNIKSLAIDNFQYLEIHYFEGETVKNKAASNIYQTISASSDYDGSTKTFTAYAIDQAGNMTTKTCSYTVYKYCDATTSKSVCSSNYGACNKKCGAGTKYSTKTITYYDKHFPSHNCGSQTVPNGCSKPCVGTSCNIETTE